MGPKGEGYVWVKYEEKALTTIIVVILYPLADVVRIIYTRFWEVGDISNLV